ncbi:hypothetical protein HHA04nite_20150 [Halomonas halophila]|uniref:Uncharacterized protein n=1 Tax=Halomonas halophila TaxID=29573 RepID=A0ABQ0U4K5_9GAMM|nr:hypothetical protein HHA04nite_20150 [Halomonas halophila]
MMEPLRIDRKTMITKEETGDTLMVTKVIENFLVTDGYQSCIKPVDSILELLGVIEIFLCQDNDADIMAREVFCEGNAVQSFNMRNIPATLFQLPDEFFATF